MVLLFDMRSNRPFCVKDHYYGFPINSIEFVSNTDHDLVLSSDRKGIKIWHQNSAKLMTAIEPTDCEINHMNLYPKSGLMFLANESPTIHAYFVPSVGSAPKWCSFLENLTEEMEERNEDIVVYDDYRFVTKQQLESVDLSHLIGSSMLRAYMHGYFINAKLFLKAKQASEPFVLEELKQKRIKEKLESERKDRVLIQKLPEINKETALRLQNEKQRGKGRSKREAENFLSDDRFSGRFFSDPDMQQDLNKEDINYLNPVVLARMVQLQPSIAEANENLDLNNQSEESLGEESDESQVTSDDEANEIKKVRNAAKKSKKSRKESLASLYGFSQTQSVLPESSLSLGGNIEMFSAENSVLDEDVILPKNMSRLDETRDPVDWSLLDKLTSHQDLSQKVTSGINAGRTATLPVRSKKKDGKKARGRKSK